MKNQMPLDVPWTRGPLAALQTRAGRARVLHLITRIDAGGSAANTLASCRLQAAGGTCRVILAHGPSPGVDPVESEELRKTAVRRIVVPHLQRRPGVFADALAFLEIVRLLRRLRPDILHTHTSKAGILGRFAARLCAVPVVVHTPHGHIFYGYFPAPLLGWFVLLERWAAKFCDRIISLTDLETADGLARGIGRPDQYVTIPSGVPLREFMTPRPGERERLRAAFDTPRDTLVFLCAARLAPVKGVDLVVEAWRRLPAPPPFLWLAGDGPERTKIENAVTRNHLDACVRFLGWQRNVPGLMQAADAFVLASRNEGMGRVYIEAMAAGLPVIGADVGGVRQIIEDGVTGLLVPPENPAAVAEAVGRLAADPALRKRLGTTARQRVFPTYDLTTMVRDLLELYAQLLAQKKRPSS